MSNGMFGVYMSELHTDLTGELSSLVLNFLIRSESLCCPNNSVHTYDNNQAATESASALFLVLVSVSSRL